MNYVDKVFNIIKEQMVSIMAADPEFYGKYNIILSNEQQFVKNKDRSPYNIYIVVKFMAASLVYGQTLLPVNINAIAEQNKIEVCQRLLLEYAQTYTLGDDINISAAENGDENDNSTYVIKQVYQSPQVMSNFNSVFEGFRSLFFMSGTFLVGKDSNPIKEITYYASADAETGTKINFVDASWNFSIQLDSQGFYGTDSITESKSKLGTLGVFVVLQVVSNDFCNKIKAIAFRDKSIAPNGIKEVFYLSIAFADDPVDSQGNVTTPYVQKMPFHMASADAKQSVGQFPLMTVSLTN